MGASPDRSGSTRRRSWKQHGTAPGRTPPPNTKKAARWLLSLALPVLIGLFVWLLWPRSEGEQHRIAIPIWATDQLTLPPLSFAREDLNQLREAGHHHIESAVVQDEVNFGKAVEQAVARVTSERDTLVLYVSAHGLAENGRAYLACSNFARRANSGRYEIDQLLAKISPSRAKVKLLILDAVRLDYDPRLGIFGNEFADLVREAVSKLPDEPFWVLLPAGGSQTSCLSYADRQSVFGKAVAEAFAGHANQPQFQGNHNDYLELGELVQYVSHSCRSWFGSNLTDYQRPVLLKAGKGMESQWQPLLETPFRLATVSREMKSAEDEPPAEAEKETSPDEKKSALRKPGVPFVASLTDPPFVRSSLAVLQPPVSGGAAPANSAESPQATPSPPAGTSEVSSPEKANSAPDSGQPAADPKSVAIPQTPAPAPPANQPPAAAASAKPTPPPTPHEQLRRQVLRLWQVRDQLRDRTSTTRILPIDFAPHLWREAEAWMLYYETSLFSTTAATENTGERPPGHDPLALVRDSQILLDNLQELLSAIAAERKATGRDEASVGHRLIDAWNNIYLVKMQADEVLFEQQSPEILVRTRDATRELHQLVYAAVDLVRWFGRANTTMADTETYRKPIADHLTDLQKLVGLLRSMEATDLGTSGESALQSFVARQQKLSADQGQLMRNLLAQSPGTGETASHFLHRRLQESLNTPLLDATSRDQMLRVLLTPTPASVATSTGTWESNGRAASTRFDWLRVRACLQLELLLWELVDEEASKKLSRLIGDADRAATEPAADEAGYAESFRSAYRLCVGEVKRFYEELPRKATSEWALHLVDPRDSVDPHDYPVPRFRVRWELPPQLVFENESSGLRLEGSESAELSVTLVATRPNLLDSRVTLSNPDDLVMIESLVKAEDLPVQRGYYRKTRYWRVALREGAARSGKPVTTIQFNARYAEGEAKTSIDLDLPQPNRVDVFFARAGIPEVTANQGTTVRLNVFPNRETKFICSLVNRYDRPKSVDVLVYAIEPRPFAQSPPGQLDAALRRSVYDDNARVLLAGKLIAKSEKPVALPAVDKLASDLGAVPVDFASPAAPMPAPPAATPGAPAAPAAPPPAVNAEPIHGLLVRIVDTQNRNDEWLYWVELVPLAPREYLAAEVGYDQRDEQIVARFTPKLMVDGQPLLPGGAVQLKWDPTGASLPAQGRQQFEGKLDPVTGNFSAVLSADAPPDNTDREVRVSVDGYPRAFLYRVSCRKDRTSPRLIPGADLAREVTRIRIENVSVPKQPKVFHFPPHVLRPPPDEKAPPIEHIDLVRTQPALFAAPAETLLVGLQADAPLDAFANTSDGIELKLSESNYSRRLRAIRDFEPVIVSCGARGLIEFQSRVSDLNVPLETGNLRNVQVAVDAQIRFRDQSDQNVVFVRLDGSDPIVQGVNVPPIVPKDGQATARFRVNDFSDISHILYGVSRDGTRRLVEATTQRRPVKVTRDDAGRQQFEVLIDFKDLAPGKILFLAKVVDLVGKESELVAQEVEIRDVQKMPEKGEIRGVIVSGSSRVNGVLFEMTIEGGELGIQPVPIKPDGSFVIPDLSPGKYTLKPRGSFSGKNVKEKEFMLEPTDPAKRIERKLDVSG